MGNAAAVLDRILWRRLRVRWGLALRLSVGTCLCAATLCSLTAAEPAEAIAASAKVSTNPVLPGDHPDPSIIRVHGEYWMTSTSGDWSPQFALYRSKDLRHWRSAGAVFPHQPKWAAESFWAPELVSDGGRVLVYYVGRKCGGPLCVAVATAAQPQGPYADHGPMVCQPDGSIDPAFARDENGKPFLIWKEDGNSVHQPTPIWAQPLSDDLLHLTGQRTQLIVNDPASWEGGVVEGPYVLRHAGRFYLFYAGNACCGAQCDYAEGVARADHLLGPWEKDPANPIIRPNGTWRCPGHGSAVKTPNGDDYFLYHAYPVKGTIYLGRESVLDRITWAGDGWPEVNSGQGPGGSFQDEGRPGVVGRRSQLNAVVDDFKGKLIGAEWRWPVNREPRDSVRNRVLMLSVPGNGSQPFVARTIGTPDYVAEVSVAGAAMASLAVVGNAEHAIGLGRRGEALEMWRKDEHGRQVLWRGEAGKPGALRLRVSSTGGGASLTYSYSSDGKQWTAAGEAVDVSKLPQWDEGLRVGLMVDGVAGETATFRHFVMRPGSAPQRARR